MSAPLRRTGVRERRERYFALRQQGVNITDAAAAVGVLDAKTRARYERWFKATERGEEIIPGKPGRARGGAE